MHTIMRQTYFLELLYIYLFTFLVINKILIYVSPQMIMCVTAWFCINSWKFAFEVQVSITRDPLSKCDKAVIWNKYS